MRKILWRCNRFFLRRSYAVQVLLFWLLTFLIPAIFMPLQLLAQKLDGANDGGPHNTSFSAVLVFAPLFETLVFQYVVFKILQAIKATRGKYVLFIVISAFLFGLQHWYSVRYIVATFGIGLLLAYVFYLYKRSMNKAFWTTVLVHSMHNGTVFLLAAFK